MDKIDVFFIYPKTLGKFIGQLIGDKMNTRPKVNNITM